MTEAYFNYGIALLINGLPGGEKVTPERIEITFQILKELPDNLWLTGVQRCLRTRKFFPAPVELAEDCLEGHLFDYFPNYHVYIEPKKLEWTEALERVRQERCRPPKIETKAEIKPPPTKEESGYILAKLSPILRAKIDQLKEIETKRAEEKLKARKLQLEDQKRVLGLKEKPVEKIPVEQKQNGGGPKWIH